MAGTDANVVALPRPRRPAVESEVLAMTIFVVTEVMLFAGFLSAYNIIGARSAAGIWPPPTDPPLPVEETVLPTAALLLSAAMVFWAGWRYRASVSAALAPILAAGALATYFVVSQVLEFRSMLDQGLTLQSSAHGGFFYTIIGAHAIHAVGALLVLAWTAWRVRQARMSPALFQAIRVYWYFVVGLWPVLYTVVYL